MGGHIVRALTSVNKRRIVWTELVGGGFEVHAHVGVGVFVDRQSETLGFWPEGRSFFGAS